MKKIALILCVLLQFSTLAQSQNLGKRINFSDVKAAKGLKFTICPPLGWEVREPSYLEATTEFVEPSTGNSLNIIVTHFPTFMSKKEFKTQKDAFIAEQEKQAEDWADIFIGANHELIEIDNYPFLKSTITSYVRTNSSGLIPYRSVVYVGIIEDLVVTITGCEFNYTNNGNKFLNIFDRVAWSARFPEQYEYINATR